MKKIYFILTLFVAIVISSCEDFLDQQPSSAISSEEYYQNDEEVESGVIACYDGLQYMYNETWAFVLMEIRSDNTTTVTHQGDVDLVDKFMDDADNTLLSEYWSAAYNTIFRTNTVLASIDNVTLESNKNQYEGEAKFIRALNYFNMVRMFGEIPLVTSIAYVGNYEAYTKATVDEVYDAIISDLQDASILLPDSYGDNDLGRATSGAAIGLLAKVYLTLQDYTNAESLLTQLMGSPYSYSIISDYHDVFYDEMNDEIIFAVRYESGVGDEGEWYSYEMTMMGGKIRGNNPTDDLLASYETGDLRYDVSVTSGDLMCGKYLSDGSQYDAENDWIVLRYADVVLMYAEVENELYGPTQAAIDAINPLRVRAGLTTFNLADYDQTSFREEIAHERRIELAMENHRWFDLLRTGKVEEVMTAHSTAEGLSYESYHNLYPIPQREIDASEGYLTQNPGY